MRAASGESKHLPVRDALERARAAGEDETVVFHLRGEGTSSPPTAEETERLAEGLFKKVVSQCGHEPKRKTVFQNLGAVAVEADADWLLKMLEQPEVHQASMNRSPSGPVEPIRPVRKSPAKSTGWVDLSD